MRLPRSGLYDHVLAVTAIRELLEVLLACRSPEASGRRRGNYNDSEIINFRYLNLLYVRFWHFFVINPSGRRNLSFVKHLHLIKKPQSYTQQTFSVGSYFYGFVGSRRRHGSGGCWTRECLFLDELCCRSGSDNAPGLSYAF